MRSLAFLLIALAGCATTGPATKDEIAEARRRATDLVPALAALEDGDLARATELASKREGPEAIALGALIEWLRGVRALADGLRMSVLGSMLSGRANLEMARPSMEKASSMLASVDAALQRASEARAMYLPLTPARMKIDFDMNGVIDENDQRLLEIEFDQFGEEFRIGDPRRKPTFAFDRGDLAWARAMISFQRAAIEIALAYRWNDLSALISRGPRQVVVRLGDAKHIQLAHRLVLDGLAHARRAREEYLLETDDDREWVPNPQQKNHAIPMPVDGRLYKTWEAILDDVDRLMRGEEGIHLASTLAALGARDDARSIGGFADVRAMFESPHDLTIDLDSLRSTIEGLLGPSLVPSMKSSPLTQRLDLMQREVDAGTETWRRKLRYLLWLN